MKRSDLPPEILINVADILHHTKPNADNIVFCSNLHDFDKR